MKTQAQILFVVVPSKVGQKAYTTNICIFETNMKDVKFFCTLEIFHFLNEDPIYSVFYTFPKR